MRIGNPEFDLPFYFLRCVILLQMVILAGCLSVHKHSGGQDFVMTQEEFGKYVEQVFRYHNQVMSDLINAADKRVELDQADASELDSAEAKMIETCGPLNDVVSESLTGQSVGLVTQMGLSKTVPECEEASHIVEDLIP